MVTLIKNKVIVIPSHSALYMLFCSTKGKKVRPQKITAGNIANFINGMRLPFGWSLLSLMNAMNGSKRASKNLPETVIMDIILIMPNNNNWGISGTKPELDGGR